MTPEDFRAAALSWPEAVESSHMGTVDFRVRKKIFATLDGDKGLATLKLQPDEQAMLVELHGSVFFPANGSWGEKGWTKLQLRDVPIEGVQVGLEWAWRNIAPSKLVAKYREDKAGS